MSPRPVFAGGYPSQPDRPLCVLRHSYIGARAGAHKGSLGPVKGLLGRPIERVMFVEGLRLLVAVLGTAAGYWAARTMGTEAQGIGGILGCLFGYVAGGLLGRALDKAFGAVERRVDKASPARM